MRCGSGFENCLCQISLSLQFGALYDANVSKLESLRIGKVPNNSSSRLSRVLVRAAHVPPAGLEVLCSVTGQMAGNRRSPEATMRGRECLRHIAPRAHR